MSQVVRLFGIIGAAKCLTS